MLCLQTPAQEKDSVFRRSKRASVCLASLLSSRHISMCQSWKRFCVRLLLNPSVHRLTKQHEEKQGRALTWGSHKSKSQSLIFMVFFYHKRWRMPLWAQDLTCKDFRDPWAWLLSQAPCCEVAKGKTSSPLSTYFRDATAQERCPAANKHFKDLTVRHRSTLSSQNTKALLCSHHIQSVW